MISVAPSLLSRPIVGGLWLYFYLISAQAAVLDCEVAGKSVNPNNGYTTEGVTGLMRCIDRDTQLLSREQELVAGKYIGLERFYEKGELQREFRINARGNREGRALTFAPGGKIIADEFLQDGQSIGLQKRYFPSGAISRLSFYELVEKNNPGNSFIQTREIASIELTEKGALRDVRCHSKPVLLFDAYDDRKLCGFGSPTKLELFQGDRLASRLTLLEGRSIFREDLASDGKRRYQFERVDGKYIERRYAQAGHLLKESQFAELSTGRAIEREKEFHESGQVISEKTWAAGRLSTQATWYLNGQPKTRVEYGEGESKHRHFHDNGRPSFEGRYVLSLQRNSERERETGTHQFFDELGRLRREAIYDEKGRISRERELDEAGKVLRDDAVFEDGSRKAFAK